jgi:hypothetical protein
MIEINFLSNTCATAKGSPSEIFSRPPCGLILKARPVPHPTGRSSLPLWPAAVLGLRISIGVADLEQSNSHRSAPELAAAARFVVLGLDDAGRWQGESTGALWT